MCWRFCDYLVLVHTERACFWKMNISLITFVAEYLCSGWKNDLSLWGEDWPLGKPGSVFVSCRVAGKKAGALPGGFQSQRMNLHRAAGRCGHQRKGSVPGVQILNHTVSAAAWFLLSCLVAGKWLSTSRIHVLHQLHPWVRASWSWDRQGGETRSSYHVLDPLHWQILLCFQEATNHLISEMPKMWAKQSHMTS